MTRIVLICLIFFLQTIMLPAQRDKWENLGPNINSDYYEWAPIISPDGRTLFFCRDGHPDNTGHSANNQDQDIWYSKLLADSTWSYALNIGAPLNNEFPNAVCSVTPDGNTLLLIGTYLIDGDWRTGCFISNQTVDGWSAPQPVNIENYYNLKGFANYCLSNDGQTMFLALQRDDSYGDLDLYISFYNNLEDVWSEPKNLGDIINTEYVESSPFMASDGESLYFTSDGHDGYGSADVFVSRRLDDSWLNWSSPINLGPSINTMGIDAYYNIPASGDFAYFVNAEDEYSDGDIYRTELPEDVKPKPVIMISGRVLDPVTGKPLGAMVYYERESDGKIIGKARTHPLTGEYKIALPSGQKYRFRAEASDFISINDNLDATDVNEYTEINRDLKFIQSDYMRKARINEINVKFGYNKWTINKSTLHELDNLIKLMREYADVRIEISGHTDDVGNRSYNNKLSEKRAKAVADYLISSGIDKSRVSYKGYGESKPIASNKTEKGRAINRRVEFAILK